MNAYTPGPCFPTITEAEFADFQRLRALNDVLLAALQAITELCEVYTNHPIHNDQRVKQARAAIAKAVL